MSTKPNEVRTAVAAIWLALAGALAGCAADEQPLAAASTATATPAPDVGVSIRATPAPATDTSKPAAPPAGDAATPKPRARGTVITTGGSDYGQMLFDAEGQAIYIWQAEQTRKPRCYADCADAWPPVLTDGDPVAAGKSVQAALGTTRRSDGTTQVTYNGHPLYFYADERPGEVRCHNVATHGGLWWVLQPNGDRAP